MKKKIHTHYDNLKISRNAPDEVIRAAYKALSQKYHPDKNSRPDASKVMAILNNSYAVLSDPNQKRKHDNWIAAHDQTPSPSRPPPPKPERAKPEQPERAARTERTKPYVQPNAYVQTVEQDAVPFWQNWDIELTPRKGAVLLVGVLVLAALMFWALHEKPLPTFLPSPAQSSAPDRSASDQRVAGNVIADATAGESRTAARQIRQAPNDRQIKVISANTAKVKFSLGPDGLPWPLGPKIYRDEGSRKTGQSTITIDNSRNLHAVHIKVALESRSTKTVSEIYIPPRRLIAVENLQAGTYRFKYRDLQSGFAMQSDPVTLDEIRTEPPAQYGMLEITLYASPTENVDFRIIPDNEF